MTARACGCSTESCGCCEGTRKLTPASTVNRPGLDAILYRVGTHGSFFETMKARLANMVVEGPGADGQTLESFYPLAKLTTRDTSDPAIALLDGWAMVGDVLTFYQERIANEGYLRTAIERRSVLELARLVGYTLRPGVAATVFLAYTLEDTQAEPVEIPAGARSQSIPGPGELPQSFETSDPLIAQREWNNLQVRLSKPQSITFQTALTVTSIYVAGINTNLKTGDQLLLVFSGPPARSVVRKVAEVITDFPADRSEIELEPLPADVTEAMPFLLQLVEEIKTRISADPNFRTKEAQARAENLLAGMYLGLTPPPQSWVNQIALGPMANMSTNQAQNVPIEPAIEEALTRFRINIEATFDAPPPKPVPISTNPWGFIMPLLKKPTPQVASSLQLGRSLKKSLALGADANTQLLVNFAHELKDTFYPAFASSDVNLSEPALKAVYVLRLEAPVFGANAADLPTYYLEDEFEGEDLIHVKGEVKSPDLWAKWKLDVDERDNVLYLDQAHNEVSSSGYVMVQRPGASGLTRQVHEVVDAQAAQRNAYGINGKTTKLSLADTWWNTGQEPDISQTLRKTLVFAQSEELVLVDEPITDVVSVTAETLDDGIMLDGLYSEFTSGRWIILSGERTDIPDVTGVKGSELIMVSDLRHEDPVLPGDTVHTTLLLATPSAYSYVRSSLIIYGNVVKATHGETTNETLGNGDGSQAMQTFELKQPPLTFVPAPSPQGVDSTLKVYVNNVEWKETDSLAGLGPSHRRFITKTADDDKTSVIFGNGKQGSRLPTGVLNVNSVYRKGIGKAGNVLPEQVSMLMTKPLGVKSVLNPLGASGGADKEDRDMARENAPLAVMALDRLVSFQDYADFTRTFAGIAKAMGRRLSDRKGQFVHLTIAGIDDIPIDPDSDLYRNLVIALQQLGDLSVAIQVDPRELVILVLSANIRLVDGYLWDPVATEIRAALLNTFGFRKRSLAQPALLCEIIACLQSVEGVAYVDVDSFGGISERVSDAGVRRLRTPDELANEAKRITDPEYKSTEPDVLVKAGSAGLDEGAFRPAQLAIFTPAVQDTIVINQIK